MQIIFRSISRKVKVICFKIASILASMLGGGDLIKAQPCASDKGFSVGSNQVEINSALFSFYNSDETNGLH